jgi:hypothetical protein
MVPSPGAHAEGRPVTSPAGPAPLLGRRIVLFDERPTATSGTLRSVSSLRHLLTLLVLAGVSAVAAAQGLPPEKLEALVSPIASFPDPLLSQVLMAAGFPDQVVAAAKWVSANPKVTGKDLEAALQGQSWDPSVKALCSSPDVLVRMMSEHMDWTRDLGVAYRNQRDAVLLAVQQVRSRAPAAGNPSTQEQTVQVGAVAAAQSAPPADAKAPAEGLLPEKLEALVSPIALFPDPLLGQVLVAAGLPDQVVAAANWAKANPKVTGKDIDAALKGQSWDASVKALCSFPDVLVKMMSEHMDWTRDLGVAYRSQKDAVLFAVQQLRARALAAGNLKSTKEQTVQVDAIPEAEATEGTATTVIRIEPTNPQVIYVPVYSPTVVYGTWVYPAYPPPPVYPPGYVAGAAMVSFSIGFAIGSSAWRYPPYPAYPRYPAYPPPRPPPAARPPASGTRPPSGGTAPPPSGGTAPPPSASTRPGTPSQQPAGGGGRNPSGGSPPSASTRPSSPQGGAGVSNQLPSGGAGAGGGPSASTRPSGPQGGAGVSNQLPSGGAGGGRSPSQLPSGGAGGGRSPGQSPASGTGDRGWGGGGARPSQGGSAFQGMNNGGQARAQSTRGNASSGGSRGGGGGRGGGRR